MSNHKKSVPGNKASVTKKAKKHAAKPTGTKKQPPEANDQPMKKEAAESDSPDDKSEETAAAAQSNHAVPREFDILCGKDKTCINHEGSRRFRAIIDSYQDRYSKCTTKQEKMEITKEIVEKLRSSGGQFLKYDATTKSWIEISQIAARDKVSHALRFACQRKERHESRYSNSFSSSVASSSETEASPNEIKSGCLRRMSDPLPFVTEDDPKLWSRFVRNQTRLLTSIHRSRSESGSHYATVSPSASDSPSRVQAQTQPPISVIDTAATDYAHHLLQEPLLEWDAHIKDFERRSST